MKKVRELNKIMIVYLGISYGITFLAYFFLPYILNYPPNSINNEFQKDIDGLSYVQQYILISLISTCIAMIFLLKKIKTISKKSSMLNVEKNINKKQIIINEIIEICIKFPFKMYIFQNAIPAILLPVVFLIISRKLIVTFKISLFFILALSLSSSITYVFANKEFQKYIIHLFEMNPEVDNRILDDISEFGLKKKILLEMMSIIGIVFGITLLLLYTTNTKLKGNLYFEEYTNELNEKIGKKEYLNKDEILDDLKNVNNVKDKITEFIIAENGVYDTNNKYELSDFFVKYALEFKKNKVNAIGRSYDYYCIDIEGTYIEVETIEGERYLAGVIYNSQNNDELKAIIIIYIFLFLIIFTVLIYIINNISKNIDIITDRFNEIIKNKNLNKELIITSNDELGKLIFAFNQIQKLTKNNLETIKNNQEVLIEKERLSGLGQMIGGIAHNLRSPIMSIAGAMEGIKRLADEYEESIGIPTVTPEDYHEITQEMKEWIEKVRNYLSYMSDIITAVKGQAVSFNLNQDETFAVDELVKLVTILMKHELKLAHVDLNVDIQCDPQITVKGNVNSLVQVVDNMIGNSIQAYEGKEGMRIDMNIRTQGNELIISIKDYGPGLPERVMEKLFKEMITTKGKNGTGLGLYMSYSNIKAHFKGDITVETSPGQGTKFDIMIPIS